MTSSPSWITVSPSAPAEGIIERRAARLAQGAPRESRASHLGNIQTALLRRITPATTIGAATTASSGSSDGIGAASAIGAATDAATAASAGTGDAAGTGASTAASTGSADGLGDAAGI